MFTLAPKMPVIILGLARDPSIRDIVLKYLRKQKRVPDVSVTNGLEKSNREN